MPGSFILPVCVRVTTSPPMHFLQGDNDVPIIAVVRA